MTKHYHYVSRALPMLAGEAPPQGDAPPQGEARHCWKKVAAQLGLSPFYFQRIFKRHTGVSPRRYAACVALSDMKARLAAGEDVLRAALAAGLSGGGRAHDLFVAADAVTPGEFGRGGDGLRICYGRGMSPYGEMFAAATERGVCLLRFLSAGEFDGAYERLRHRYPAAVLRRDDARAAAMAGALFCGGGAPLPGVTPLRGIMPLPLHVRGTNFQINVWRALLALPAGAVVSYRGLADAVAGGANAARAVAGAVAANPVAVLIPCHRVLAADGRLAGYAWGTEKKRALLAREFAAGA